MIARFLALFVLINLVVLADTTTKKKPRRTLGTPIPQNTKMDTIHVEGFRPKEVMQIIQKEGMNPIIIDVRSPNEFASGHIKGAINIPITEIEQRLQELKKSIERNIITVCDSGTRGMQACGILRANKFAWVWYMKGGLTEWSKQGFAVEK